MDEIRLPEYPELSRKEFNIRREVLTTCNMHKSWGVIVSGLSDAEAGKVWKMIFQYMNNNQIQTEEVEQLSDLAKAVLKMAIINMEDNANRAFKTWVKRSTKTIKGVKNDDGTTERV